MKGRIPYREGELNPRNNVPKGTFPGKNFMTPELVGYYKTRKGYAELSTGEGFLREPIFGVTVKPDPDHALSKVCFTKSEALTYIKALS
jgi:hypothetical protein